MMIKANGTLALLRENWVILAALGALIFTTGGVWVRLGAIESKIASFPETYTTQESLVLNLRILQLEDEAIKLRLAQLEARKVR